MPLVPLDFEGKGVFSADSSSSSSFYYPFQNPYLNQWDKVCTFVDSIGSQSPPTSTSTLSSSLIGGSADSAGVAAVSAKQAKKWQESSSSNVGAESGCGISDLHHIPTHLEIAAAADCGDGGTSTRVTAAEKCRLGMEDWESVLSESAAASPIQEQSILRWIMGDVDDPSVGLNRILQTGSGGGGGTVDYDLSGGFGVVDQGFPTTTATASGSGANLHKFGFPQNLMPISLSPSSFNQPPPQFDTPDIKPTVFNPQILINQNQHNPSFVFPMPFNPHQILPPQAKRHNPGTGTGFDSFNLLPHYPQNQSPVPAPAPVKGEEILIGNQQAIIDQLINSAELIQSGNSILAQGILARLNHHLSPNGKPFYRASFFLKEALLSLLHGNNNPNPVSNPFNLIFKIDAYKSLSEISPLLQFANFTSNQAILESLEGCNRIHIIDFDIGYGGQWASLMQELALRNGGPPTLRITAFTHDHNQLELGLTRENLNHFAHEIGIPFEFDVQSLGLLNPHNLSDGREAIAVNLPVGGSFWNHQSSLPSVLQFVKQLSPRIIVSIDRGCDRTDLPFPHHLIHAVQSNSNLLESLDAVNVNLDVLQKIERFLIQPSMEKIVLGRFRSMEKTPHWRTLFLSSGLSPLTFSNFAESQAECVMKRTPVRGFHVEKRQSCSLVLCWHRKELISASAWRC